MSLVTAGRCGYSAPDLASTRVMRCIRFTSELRDRDNPLSISRRIPALRDIARVRRECPNDMTSRTSEGPDDARRLKEMGHLSAAVGHNVINAFSAMVSNAELIRSHAKDPNCDLAELAALAAAIIENALGASHVPRRLIDLTTACDVAGFDQVGDPPALIDLNQLIRDTVQSHTSRWGQLG